MQNIKAMIFDWGDTIMRDYAYDGPMWKWEKVSWIEGAEKVLKEFKGRYKCIIATSAKHSDTEEMIQALQRVGADQYFDYFYSRREIGYAKPDLKFFATVAGISGFDPDQCVMIGNSYEKDIVGASEAGMTTVFFNENNTPGDYPKADHIITSLDKLLSLF